MDVEPPAPQFTRKEGKSKSKKRHYDYEDELFSSSDIEVKKLRQEVQSMVLTDEYEENPYYQPLPVEDPPFLNPFKDPNVGSRITIRVRTLTSRVIQVALSIFETVRDLKERILVREGIPIDNQRLVYRGKVINDSQMLAMYALNESDDPSYANEFFFFEWIPPVFILTVRIGVQDNDVMHLVLGLR